MEYISSDTNVWFDYYAISKLDLPFRLNCTYIIFYETLRQEIITPLGLIDELRSLGLVEIDLTEEEYFYADELSNKYPKLTGYDAIALSVAKNRSILLLTGDEAMRKVAAIETIDYIGSIGLLDLLLNESRVTSQEYLDCLQMWKNQAAGGRRLPIHEIDKRIKQYTEREV